jgi:hypothetical protein
MNLSMPVFPCWGAPVEELFGPLGAVRFIADNFPEIESR